MPSPSVSPVRSRRRRITLGMGVVTAGLAVAGWIGWAPATGPGRAAPARQGGGPGDTYVLSATWPLPEAPAEPIDIALGAGGELYVADGKHNTVLAYDGAGRLRDTWQQSDGQGAIFVPVAVAVDAERDLVHVLWQQYRRVRGDLPLPAGNFLDTRQSDGTPVRPLQFLFLDNATDLAVHGPSGDLFVSADHAVNRFRPGPVPGRVIQVGDTRGAAGRLAVTPDETIALVRPAQSTVALMTAEGAPVGSLDLAGHAPLAVAADADNLVHVLVRGSNPDDPGAKLLMSFTSQGQPVRTRSVGSLSAPPVPASDWPWALAAGPAGLALSTGATRFQVLDYDADGQVRARLVGSPVRPAYTPRLAPPTGAAPFALSGAAGGALVAFDGRDANLVRYAPDGAWTYAGSTPDDTLDIAAGAEGTVYATTADGRVLRLPPGDGQAPVWEGRCDCDLGGRIAAGPAAVYVSRPREHTVATFNPTDGLRLRAFRLNDSISLWPSDLVVTGEGRLFTSDLVSAQVQGWLRPDAPDTVWQAGLLSGPRRLAAGRMGQTAVIAAIMADGFVEVHSAADGNLLARWRPEIEGKPFDMADIALGQDGEVYLADARTRAVRVFAPGIGIPASPVPDPSATPTPSSLACDVRGDKRAGPSTLVLGQTAAVTLTLAARCPASTRVIGADILLVMDRSGSMAGAKLAAAQGAARSFAELLDVRYHRLGLASFSDDATVDVPLTSSVAAVIDGLARLGPAGETNMAAAIDQALRHLQGFSRAEALPVIILLTDGQYSPSTADPRIVAAQARGWGAQIYAVGLGDDVAGDVLAAITGDRSRYFFAPTPSELYPIYNQILRLVLASLAGNLTIDDEMAPDISYVDGSALPSALVAAGRLRWGRSLLPASGITLTYRVRPQVEGCLPTNQRAVADYTDADGVRRQFTFPVPTICVVKPSPTPTASPTPTRTPTVTPSPTVVPRPIYLPIVAKCLASAQHSDIVLVIDTSDSMAGAKIEQARQAARTFVGLLDLPRDQAAVVGFNTTARLASRLTGDRGTLEAAIRSLINSPGTRIDVALLAATGELLSGRRRPQNRAVIVLLSDGAHNGDPADVLTRAAEARRLGASLYAIGLGADADRALLEQVAGRERTYYAADGAALEAIYREVAAAIPCR